MAKRFVRARPRQDRLSELRERLDSGEIEAMEPFGRAMTRALEQARFGPESGEAVWIEEDYCSPPLAMERSEVLDDYFEDITVVEEALIGCRVRHVEPRADDQKVEFLHGARRRARPMKDRVTSR